MTTSFPIYQTGLQSLREQCLAFILLGLVKVYRLKDILTDPMDTKFNQRSGYGSGDLKRSLKILICNINYAGIYCCNWHNPQNIMVETSGKKPDRE